MREVRRMLKRMISFVLVLALMLSLAENGISALLAGGGSARAESAEGNQSDETGSAFDITTGEEFMEAVCPENANAVLNLLNDITLPSEYAPSVHFSGVLNGNGHTIYGLNITQDTLAVSGLFLGLDGAEIQNMNIADASMHLVDPAIDIDSKNWNYAYGILAGYARNSAIRNCTVSGTVIISVEQDTVNSLYVGGLIGTVNYGCEISDCTSSANVTVSANTNAYVGGLAGSVSMIGDVVLLDSAYDGDVRVNFGGSGKAYVTGLGISYGSTSEYFTGCSVRGSIWAEAAAGNVEAIGICQMSGGNSDVEIYAKSESGLAKAIGALHCVNMDFTGNITAETVSGTAEAMGVNGMISGSNSGSVRAISTGSGSANAYGAGADVFDGYLHHFTNYADVTATGSDEAYAIGIQAGTGSRDVLNKGTVNARADRAATAFGISFVRLMDGKGIQEATNDAKVSAAAEYANAHGLAGCTFSANNGNISANSEEGKAKAVALSGCDSSENRGMVFSTGVAYGADEGYGLNNDSHDCVNYGTIEAINMGEGAAAYGVIGIDCQNQGEVRALDQSDSYTGTNRSIRATGAGGSNVLNTGYVHAESIHHATRAYGISGTGTSTGDVYAATDVFHIDDGYDGHNSSCAYDSSLVKIKLGSTALRAVSGGLPYYIVYCPNGCIDHGLTQGLNIINKRYECSNTREYYIVIAEPSDAAEYVEPELPEIDPDAEDDITLVVGTGEINLVYLGEAGQYPQKIDTMDSRCGTLTFGDLRFDSNFAVEVSIRAKQACEVKLTLPDGFSFEEWSVSTEKTLTVSAGLSDYSYPVWPLYVSEKAESVTFRMRGGVRARRTVGVQKAEDAGNIYCRPTAAVNFSDEPIIVNSETDFGVDFAKNFVSGTTSYQKPLAGLGAALTQAVYGSIGGGRDDYMEESFANLGFSNIKYYQPAIGATGVAVALAQKKVVENGELRNVLMIVVRGTYSWDWIGNFMVYGNEEGHANFISAAREAQENINQYVKEYMSEEICGMTRVYVCGHSRGGAVSNLLTYWMKYEGWNYFFDSMTSYTYAAACSLESPVADSDVTNLLYLYDIVGYAPFEYYRYGTTYVLGMDGMPAGVETAFFQYSRGRVFTMPEDNRWWIYGLAVFGLSAEIIQNEWKTGEQLLTMLSQISDWELRIWDALLKNEQRHTRARIPNIFDLVKDRVNGTALTAQAIIAGAMGSLAYLIPSNMAEPWSRRNADEIALAHSGENYIAWTKVNGISGAITEDVAKQYFIDRMGKEDGKDFLEFVAKKSTELLEETGKNLQRGVRAAGNALQNMAGRLAYRASYLWDAGMSMVEMTQRSIILAGKIYDATRDLDNAVNLFGLPLWATYRNYKQGATMMGVACPVDVNMVMDSGAVAVEGDQLTAQSGNGMGGFSGDTHFVMLPGGEAGELTINGTGEGEMQIVLIHLDEDMNLISTEAYLDIPVHAGSSATLSLGADVHNRTSAVLNADGTEYLPFAGDDFYMVSVTADAETAAAGDTVTWTAEAAGADEIQYVFRLLRDGEILQSWDYADTDNASYTLTEAGVYQMEAAARDAEGRETAYMASEELEVSAIADPNWGYTANIYGNVVPGTDVWLGNLYGVSYAGNALTNDAYTVSIRTNVQNADARVVYTDDWTDGVNFRMDNMTSGDLVANITVSLKNPENQDYADLVLRRSVHVIAAEEAVAPTVQNPETDTLVVPLNQTTALQKPTLNNDAFPQNADWEWWTAYRLDRDDIGSFWEDDNSYYIYPMQTGVLNVTICARPAANAELMVPIYARQIIACDVDTALRLPENLKRLEALALDQVANRLIYIPHTVEYIADDAFGETDGLIILTDQNNTYVTQWCADYQVPVGVVLPTA